MRRQSFAFGLLVVVLACSNLAYGATRQWQSGKLLDTEQQKVKEESTTTYTTDGQAKNKSDGKTDYSQNTTATTADNIDTYEVYTIQGAGKTYIAREKLLFPWSKPANVTVGAELKYAIDGRKLYILDDDQKEHKASIVKTSLNEAK
ncbi:hypothetical protein H7849_00450 [Alloacidobacterium dinghuense]|uniref:Uncharacterized protein n=1 Tax=Alloacidobacterium dinghuense TaxID=2763107 RepID=A0A7G8BJ19_9BACT|nr:hypothetical protein [Alloacidobacterium dinghuense]QNI32539.1 hypothetical protein H7849_00450 [Alloacidobacterium dinghuense]